jgi:uncharacterized protein (TIGR04551 family)
LRTRTITEVIKMSDKAGKLSWLAIGLPIALALAAPPAYAQMGGMSPGMGGMGPGMGKPPGPHDNKEEGPAENAPDAEDKAPSTDNNAGYLNQSRRRTKIVEFDGYLRVRTDYLYKMNMDQGYTAGSESRPPSLPPFPVSAECLDKDTAATGTLTQPANISCKGKGTGNGNLRLRIEPTLNISDQVRVRTQLDIFDNLILGSSPDSLVNPYIPDASAGSSQPNGQTSAAAPTDVLSTTQNTSSNSIVAKRAWGEVDTELGSLRFGRMPWHFGRGMYFNRGECADCEGGTTVDRIMALTSIYGHQVAAAWDFGAQGYNLGYTDLGQYNAGGFPLDLTQKDDVTQFMAALTKIDDDKTWRERIASGDVVVNYGAQLVYRSQDYATYNINSATGSPYNLNARSSLTANDFGHSLTVNVNALLFIPSIWFKLGWKALTLEFEGTMLAGKMGNAGPLKRDTNDPGLRILQAGWVLAGNLRLYSDSLFVGFETGGATGDQAELAYSGNTAYYPYLNYRYKFVPQPAGDRSLNDFHFSPEYHVDEILYRRILGTVSNAIYFKPSVAYWLDLDSAKIREVGISGSVIYSLAPVPVSTPGNSLNYGVEMDLGLHYRNTRENFFAGATWGVFWPMAALSRPAGDVGSPLWGSVGAQDANAAQVVRTFLGIRF